MKLEDRVKTNNQIMTIMNAMVELAPHDHTFVGRGGEICEFDGDKNLVGFCLIQPVMVEVYMQHFDISQRIAHCRIEKEFKDLVVWALKLKYPTRFNQ